ncbi:3-oxoacyl-[acyl-carrier-protein] reductase FabG [Leucoagaricus sp. SymC.cos]|nr:3-oxoacyl-[acyl-carrier-protein] reductase FabG [Leucoagaricus sp. SymC.cos]
MDLGLDGVHVLVTGASGGIGLEISRLFVEQGAKVTAQFNTNQSTLQPLLSHYRLDKIQALQANLTDEVAVATLFKNAAASSFGDVSVLILNHGIWPTADEPIWKMPLERWRKTIDTNLTSSFIVAKEYMGQLRNATATVKDRASIIMIGSAAGKVGEAGHIDYASSKSAMMYGFTLSLKNEIVKIAPKGRVNTVAPGWVKTPMAEEALKNPAIVYQALATTPLKKVAVPYDVATQVVVLSSQKVSGHITGQVLMVDGGFEGRLLNKPDEI